MTVVIYDGCNIITYIISEEQLVRILPWVVTSNKYLYSTARRRGGGEYLFFFLYDGRWY